MQLASFVRFAGVAKLGRLLALALMAAIFPSAAGFSARGNNLKPRSGLRMSLLPGQVSKKVIVTGAAGRTGSLVFSLLDADPRFDVVGLVRSESSARKLIAKTGCALEEVVISDVTRMELDGGGGGAGEGGSRPWPCALDGAEAMVVCTSAVPQVSKLSVLKALLKIPLNVVHPSRRAINFSDLKFKWKPGQYPEMVDYIGQRKQIELAKKLGVKHVVLVSSMGGLDPDNFLNQIGKDRNGNGHGDILVWKRRAERALCLSGLQYTIIHPGGLVDAEPGAAELVLDVDDALMGREEKSISRGDVAGLCVAALAESGDRSVSFDCVGRKMDKGREEAGEVAEPVTVKNADEAFREFLWTGKTADYTLGPKGM